MPTFSRHETSVISYIAHGPDGAKSGIRFGTHHRYTFRGAVVEVIRDIHGKIQLISLIHFAGLEGVALERKLKCEARKKGKTPDELEWELCLMVAHDVETAPVAFVTEAD